MSDGKTKKGIAIVVVIIIAGVILWIMSRLVSAHPGVGECKAGTTNYMFIDQHPQPDFVFGYYFDHQTGKNGSFMSIKWHFQTFVTEYANIGKITSIQLDCAMDQFNAITGG